MDISSLLQTAVASGAVEKLAGKLGVDNAQAKKLIALGAPVLLSQLSKNAETPDGASALYGALDKHSSKKTNIADDDTEGHKIIGHVFGDAKDSAIGNIAKETGVSSEQAGGALAALAPLLMSGLGAEKASGNLSLENIGWLLSSTTKAVDSNSLLNSLALNLLDKNNDGDYKDDLLRMGVNWLKGKFSK